MVEDELTKVPFDGLDVPGVDDVSDGGERVDGPRGKMSKAATLEEKFGPFSRCEDDLVAVIPAEVLDDLLEDLYREIGQSRPGLAGGRARGR